MSSYFEATVLTHQGGADKGRSIRVDRLYNLGSATRSADFARLHQEEVAKEGVSISFDIPAPRIYPLSPWVLTTESDIVVQGRKTSGEVEIVLVVSDELLVGVGSDHTDRDLERLSIPWSKQVCPNIVAPELWRWTDVEDHWDECVLSSYVDGDLYQRVPVQEFLRPVDILQILRERARPPIRDFVVFCGTSVSVSGRIRFGQTWRIGLSDPVLGRTIDHEYEVVSVFEDILPEFRVALKSIG